MARTPRCPPRSARRPVSDSELELLKVLWEEGPATPAELRARLADAGSGRAYTTVQTLLHRLFAKGWVSRRKAGQARRYEARRTREELLASQLDDVARRVCDGLASPLVQTLVRGGGLGAEELAELRTLVAQAEKRARRAER